jgi:hypothetical protein
MKRALYTTAAASAVILGSAVACDNVAGPGNERVSLSLQVPRGASLNAEGVSMQASADVLASASDPSSFRRTLRIDAIQVEFSRVDLERIDDDIDDVDTDGDTDSEDSDLDSDERDNVRLRGPFTVELPLEGGVITPVGVDIPFGTFDEVKLRVSSLTVCGAVDDNRDGDFTDPGEQFTGAPGFPCVRIPVRAKLELDLNPPLVVDENTDPLNITVSFQPNRFFVDRDGRLLDPRLLATDRRLQARFRSRLRAAIRAFEDRNRNGEDDRDTDSDDRHGGHGHG